HQRQVIVLHRVLRGPVVLGVLVEYGVGRRWGFLRLVGQLAVRIRALLRCSSVPPDSPASRLRPADQRRAAPGWQVRWWWLPRSAQREGARCAGAGLRQDRG